MINTNIPNPFKQKTPEEQEQQKREQEIKQSIQEVKEEEAMQKRAELNKIHEEELHNRRKENMTYKAQQQASKERQYGRGTAGKVNEFASKSRQGLAATGNAFLRLQEASSHGVKPKAPKTYTRKQRYARTANMQPPAQAQESSPFTHLFDISSNPIANRPSSIPSMRSTGTRDFGELLSTKHVFRKRRW